LTTYRAGVTQRHHGLPKVTVPVLVTNGVDDAGVPAENTRRIVDRLTRSPHKEVVLFAGASHGMMFQDQDKFVTTVLDFAGK
jgi:pimeloyl-ACP methyl ester carboxylesterase